ncbi:MAG: TonB-dependent receptor [Muribaculaceae bacterium]|nr:TonB-dependent receptor [Muribaculaceae bacterium]
MKQLIFILLQMCLFAAAIEAQTVVSGNVIEKATGEPVIGANVMLKSSAGDILKFAVTGSDGSFSLKLSTIPDSCVINVSMMGMRTYSSTLPVDITQPLVIKMEEGTLRLKEVTVKADRIRENGDTITYHVAGFAQKQDRTIGDVLNRMPGIDVESSGKIKYQGTDINKFYIEGSDLLGGKYGIATNGISHDDVGAVEVMENHQPMQVLSGLVFSDRAALNLKLKNKSKATWIVNGHAAGGWTTKPEGALWDGELFAMTAMPGFQTITTLKSNNTGTDLRDQVKDHIYNPKNTSISDYLSLSLPDVPSLKHSRTLFNRSHLVSSNNLWKAGTTDIKAQVDYYNHRATATSQSVTTYMLPDGNSVITEDRDGVEHGNRLTGLFSVEANEKKYFLNNTLRTSLNWDDLSIATTGTMPNTQTGKIDDYYISNDLKIIKRFGKKHLVTFTSANEWESLPQRLTVTSESEPKTAVGQRVNDHAFYSNEKAAYSFFFRRINVSLAGGFEGYLRSMNSTMDSETQNDVTTNYAKLFVTPKFEYELRRVTFILGCPINLYHYKFNQALGNRTELFHSPSLTLRWKPGNRLTMSLSGNLGRSPMSLHDIHDGLILSNYRTLHRGVERFYINSRKSLMANMFYRHSRHGIFANMVAVKSWSGRPYKTTSELVDDYIIYSFTDTRSKSRMFTAIGNISKSLDFIRGTAKLKGSYNRSSSSIISDKTPTTSENTTYSMGASVNGTPFSRLFLSYGIDFQVSSLAMNGMKRDKSVNHVHTFDMGVTLADNVNWNTNGEYYHNRVAPGQYKDMFMLDSKISWKINKRVELQLSAANILDRKRYSYTTYSDISSMQNTRYLRGRSFMLSLYLKK